jgi:hypothetical protein
LDVYDTPQVHHALARYLLVRKDLDLRLVAKNQSFGAKLVRTLR